jgi:hypothetical protein
MKADEVFDGAQFASGHATHTEQIRGCVEATVLVTMRDAYLGQPGPEPLAVTEEGAQLIQRNGVQSARTSAQHPLQMLHLLLAHRWDLIVG